MKSCRCSSISIKSQVVKTFDPGQWYNVAAWTKYYLSENIMKIIDYGTNSYIWSEFCLDNLSSLSYWVLDLEGTGLDFNNDRITQFGAISVDRGEMNETCSFKQLVNPGKRIPLAIEKLCGITNEMVADAPTFTESFNRFLQASGNRVWTTQAGYEHDVPLILAECKRNVIDFPECTIIDTKVLFAFLHPEEHEIFNTDFLLKYYGIDIKNLKRHDAMGDAKIISKIFIAELNEIEIRGIKSINVRSPLIILKSMPGMSPELNWTIS